MVTKLGFNDTVEGRVYPLFYADSFQRELMTAMLETFGRDGLEIVDESEGADWGHLIVLDRGAVDQIKGPPKPIIKVQGMAVVRFDDLPGAFMFNNADGFFDKVSTGDAEHTLVKPEDLIYELDRLYSHEFPTLRQSLSNVPPGVLIALDG